MKGNWGLMRLTCARCAPASGVWGHAPPEKFKNSGFAGAFWSGFDTSKQLTSVHRRALTARASRSGQSVFS